MTAIPVMNCTFMRRSLSTAAARVLEKTDASGPGGDEHREVALAPRDARVEPRGPQPPELLGGRARLVVDAVDRGHDVGRILGNDDVAEHEPPARREDRGDA